MVRLNKNINSYAEENYLKVIYSLSLNNKKKVDTKSIAEKIDTKPSSVTDMIKKLAEKDLLNYEKYHGVKLTGKGEMIAIGILRKHRLWEEFLSHYLEIKWDEIHDIAEELEHVNSELLIENLDRFLNYPKFDPHGDPIPDRRGIFPANDSTKLSEMVPGNTGIVTGLAITASSFLRYLDDQQIHIGTEIEVIKQIDYDLSTEILIDGKYKSHLSRKVTENVLIKRK